MTISLIPISRTFACEIPGTFKETGLADALVSRLEAARYPVWIRNALVTADKKHGAWLNFTTGTGPSEAVIMQHIEQVLASFNPRKG